MSSGTWAKWFWSDWESDEALAMCTPGAQALWMRMLCVMAKADGFLTIKGNSLGPADMAGKLGWAADDVARWWGELDRWGVFSMKGDTAYSRRMVREAKKAKTARENGSKGGNPSLVKDKTSGASDNLKATDAPGRVQKPESRSQSPEARKREEEDVTLSRLKTLSPATQAIGIEAAADRIAAVLPPARAKAALNVERIIADVPEDDLATLARGAEAYYGHADQLREDGKYSMGLKRFVDDGEWRAWAKARNVAPPSPFAQPSAPDPALMALTWTRWAEDYYRIGTWDAKRGPPPGKPNCPIPDDFLARFAPPKET